MDFLGGRDASNTDLADSKTLERVTAWNLCD